MPSHLTLEFIQSLVSLLVDAILDPLTRTDLVQMNLPVKIKHMLRAKKHLLFDSRVIHFWSKIWWVEEMLRELALKFETTAILQTMKNAKLLGQI